MSTSFATSNKFCVIVDGCSTGKYLAKFLHQQKYNCIHIQSTPVPLAIAKDDFNKDDYCLSLTFNDNYSEILSELSRYPLSFIIPGSEPGVELAAQLSHHFELFSNGPALGENCRNKYKMGRTLQEKGIPCIKQQIITSVQEALLWAKAQQQWPLVVKPLDSGGGDGFFICESEEDIIHAVENVLSATTIFEKKNKEALVQEYLVGEEYVVNTLSYDSEHFLDSLMIYEKRKLDSGKLVYESAEFISPPEAPTEELFSYVCKCLDALGLKYGPSHTEVMYTKNGPILIECGARVMGGAYPPQILNECLGRSQVELTTLLYTNPKAFFEAMKRPYQLKKRMKSVLLVSSEEGLVEEIRFLDQIHKLKSFFGSRIYVYPGRSIKKTVDLTTSPGDIFLAHSRKDIIEKDALKIREWEQSGMFVLAKNAYSAVC